jgi:acetyl esterase/lipase
MQTLAHRDPALTEAGLRVRAHDYLAGTDPALPTASPLRASLQGLPPVLIQAGSHEVLLDDSVRFAGHASAAHVAVTLEVTPGVPHVFQGFFDGLDEGSAALDRVGRFLRSHAEQGSHD